MAVEFIQDPGFINDIGVQCPVLAKADEAALPGGSDRGGRDRPGAVGESGADSVPLRPDDVLRDPRLGIRTLSGGRKRCGTYGRTILIHRGDSGLDGIF